MNERLTNPKVSGAEQPDVEDMVNAAGHSLAGIAGELLSGDRAGVIGYVLVLVIGGDETNVDVCAMHPSVIEPMVATFNALTAGAELLADVVLAKERGAVATAS